MSSRNEGESPQRRFSGIPLQNINTTSSEEAPFSQTHGASVTRSINRNDPSSAAASANLLGPSAYWDQPYDAHYHDVDGLESPIDPSALQAALPPDIRGIPSHGSGGFLGAGSPYVDETPASDYSGSDREPLTANPQPIAGSLVAVHNDGQPRDSFQTVSDVDNFGRDAQGNQRDIEHGLRSHQHHGFGMSLNPNEYRISRSPSSAGALQRAGSIVRAMSQRVVNISGESEVVDNRASRHRSSSPQQSRNHSRHGSRTHTPAHSREASRTRSVVTSIIGDTSYHSHGANQTPEKDDQQHLTPEVPSYQGPLEPLPNPLRGKSLGVFSKDSRIRNRLCDLLVNPYTEPLILLLIIAQTVLLAVESGHSVFQEGHNRPEVWGQQALDWAILGLFIVFTLEVVVRIIVSGFLLNAAEYSTIDRNRGIKAAVVDQYRAIFQPNQAKTYRNHVSFKPTPSAFARSFTTILQGPQRLPETLEEQQRYQLARRAFLRHGFNRLDFVAVCAYWISFILGVTGAEKDRGLYVFKMLSCLRILRLLSITNGTAVILRSLKKAAPLLVRVAFFISFFWLLFAIVGVQSFKESLSRQCVWIDPQDPTNLTAAFTNSEAFCGGYLNQTTGAEEPWVRMVNPGSLDVLDPGTSEAKGFLCPRGSICLQQENPHGGTVSFDDIFHSLELVFIIMSANTFTDLMYWTMGSDYMLAALYFGAGIMIMLLWLVNLLIAVITSSFQVIREESKSSAFTTAEEPLIQEPAEDRFRKASFIQRLYTKSNYFWIMVIVFGLLAQSLRSSTMSPARGRFIDLAEVVVTIVLDIEMIIRISADWRGFHRKWRNLYDLGLAIMTSIILLPPIRGTRAYWWLSIFQILRVYRVVLAVPVTRKLILLVLGNASGIANLMLFVFLTTFLVAILAAQLFRGVLAEGSNVTFYNMFNSFVGMYQILTSENWTDILYNVTETTTVMGTSWIGATFLIGWFILSFFILINMFIAVIQENFDISEDEKRFEQVKAFLQRREIGTSSSNLALSTIFSFGRTRQRKDPLDYGPALTEMLLKDNVVRDFLEESYNRGSGKTEQEPGPTRATTGLLTNDIRPGYLSTLWGRFVRKITKREPNPFYSNIRLENSAERFDAREMAQQAVNAASSRRKAQREYLAKYPKYNTSLYLFPPKHKLRRFCQTIVGPARGHERIDGVEPNKLAWYSFSAFIYCAIVAMVVLACVTTPLYQKQYQTEHPFSITNWYVWTDMAFAVLFSAESIIKIIADGLLWTPNAYLRSSWGLVDSVVLITLWINVVTLFVNDGAISRAVGAFKALRALRLLNVSDSARDTFHSLIIKGWWKILAAAFVSISLLIPFAIYGLNLFNGLLIACNDEGNIINLASCFGEFDSTPFSNDWPMLAPRVATNPYFKFDDFGASLFTLFQIVSQEGWADVVFATSAITSRGMQPQSLASEGNAIFFIVFNILATVFVLTLFISVFMRNYTEQTGVAFLTADQRSWLEVRKLLRQISPSKSSYNDKGKAWKKWCHKRAIEKRGKWYQAVTMVLVLHLILLVTESTSDPEWWRITRTFIFLAFIVIYMVSITIRIIGLGWTRYRRSSWDLYALMAVFGAFVSTAAMLIANHGNMQVRDETYVQIHKFFLVAIVLMVIPRNDALDQLFKTAAASLTVISNLLATWLVLFLVFAIAFTQAFSLTRFGGNESNNINFRTVPKALILLFRMSFGEGWNALMEDFAFIEPPLCVEEEDDFFRSDCGSKSWARFLFVAWNIISMYIFVSLFVSLIYESFSYVYQRSSGMGAIDRDELRRFKEAWRSVDPDGTGWISKDTFPRLLGELSGIFQMRIYEPEDSVHSILEDIRGHDARAGRHMSVVSSTNATSIDLQALNQRLARLDVAKIQERRRRFNVFYREIMTTADVDRGINFTNVLMTLAQYNIVTDSKSLRLDEFLRRRARLQRVEEDIRRRIVQGFFETLYLTREFKKHMRQKAASRMTGIPEIMVPDIFVDDDNIDEFTDDGKQRGSGPATPTSHLSVDLGRGNRGSVASRVSSSVRNSAWINPGHHPLSAARLSSSNPPSPSHQATTSAYSFELFDPDPQVSSSNEMRRRGSANSPTKGPDMMDDTVWMDSIRKSATIRRSGKSGSYRFTDLG